MIVQACLNGARPAGFHPHLPTTPEKIIANSVDAVDAGADELHIHMRGDDGAETLAPAVMDETMRALRRRLPGTLIGISTGDWIEGDDTRRLACIDGWHVLPDYASVNLGEQDAPAVYQRLARRGIAVEAGLADMADTQRLIALGLASASLRILIEIAITDRTAAHALADAMLARLGDAGIAKPVLIHGFDGTVWSFVERAAAGRYSTRVGLEDGSTLPDGRTARDNAEIVAAARAIMGRRPR